MGSAEPRSEAVTLATVWRIEPEMQAGFVDAITGVLTDVIRQLPGFQGADVLASRNGTEVLVEIEWQTLAHVQNLERVPEVGRALRGLRHTARPNRNVYRRAARIESA
jgi:heme-degrading monooxygenase HmoA